MGQAISFVVVVSSLFFVSIVESSLGKEDVRYMFGRMSAMPIARLDAGKEIHVAVAELLAATDYPEIGRWIQFPRGLMLVL